MRISPCDACPLGPDACAISGEYRRRTPDGWGVSPEPRPTPLMVLGAAGGFMEEQDGRPMVGPSGRKLMSVLEEVGLNECYISNAAKCVPLDHGDPTKEQVKVCRPRLDEEINVVRPKFIIALGNTAVQRLLGKGTISAVDGKEQWSPRHGAWVLPAYHPAYLLRSPGRESSWRLGMHRYAHLVRGDIPLPGKPDCRSLLVETPEHLRYVLKRLTRDPWVFDFETNAEPWWSVKFAARSVAFAFDDAEAHVVLLDHPQQPLPIIPTELLKFVDVGNVSAAQRVAHNAMFDALVWYRITGHIPFISFDTMVAAHLLDENRPKSLKWLGRALLGWPDWDIDLASKTASKSKDPTQKMLSVEEFAFYNAADAVATYRLWPHFRDQIRADERLWRYWNALEMPKLRALIRMVARGVYVDMPKLRTQRDRAAANWEQAKQRIPVANCGSAEQVAHWLYDAQPDGLGLTPLKMGKKHGSTDEPSIKRLAQQHPEVRAILPVRKWRRYVDTYFETISPMVEESFDERYHPDIRSTGTETGRLSSPFHTIPRPTPEDGAFVRSTFTAPPGYVLIEADFSAVEARLAAWVAGGKPASLEGVERGRANMLYAFLEDRQVYMEQAAQNIYGDPNQWHRITKNERQIMGKVPVLAMLYRISAEGLRDYAWREYEIDWDRKTATRIWLGFHRLWPEFKLWHEREERVLRARGWTVSLVGRLRRLPEATGFGKAASEAVGAGINMPIQSTASDLTQESMIILDAQGVPIVGNVHDALLLYVRNGVPLPQVARMLERVMTREALRQLAPLGLHLPPGLIQVEVKAGAWGAGELVV